MSYFTVTTTTTNPPVTIVCSRAMLITTTVVLASISVSQTILGQNVVVLLSQVILRDTMRVSASHINMLQQQQPHSQMPSHTYANCAINMMGIQLWGLSTVIQSPCLPYMVGRDLFQVVLHWMTQSESVVAIKCSDSGVGMGISGWWIY